MPVAATLLRTQLADYIVAHSEYSTPLMRRNVLSALVTAEDQTASQRGFAGATGAAQAMAAGAAAMHSSDPCGANSSR